MKKSCIILFDCHGELITQYLRNYKLFSDIYKIKYIANYTYKEKDFNNEIKDNLRNCDLIIMQHIKNDRKYIHHDIIKSYLKESCKPVILPHYVFNGYFIDYILPDEFKINNNYNNLLNIWNNLSIDEEIIKKNLYDSFEEIKNLEKNSSIQMIDFIMENYKKNRLFNSRGYPTYIFFGELTKRILKNIDFEITNYKVAFDIWGINTWIPILPCVKNILNLEFDCFNLIYSNTDIFNSIEYIITCKELNIKELNLAKNDGLAKLKYYKNILL